MDKIFQRSYKGRIETGKVRTILTYFFRIPHQCVQSIYRELKEMGLIEFENHRIIIVKWKPED